MIFTGAFHATQEPVSTPVGTQRTHSIQVQVPVHTGHSYPLSGVVQHLLPSGVKLSFVILQQPLLGQGDGLLGSTEHLGGPLEVLCGFLSFQLSLLREKVM